jgi:hypothetical protein
MPYDQPLDTITGNKGITHEADSNQPILLLDTRYLHQDILQVVRSLPSPALLLPPLPHSRLPVLLRIGRTPVTLLHPDASLRGILVLHIRGGVGL